MSAGPASAGPPRVALGALAFALAAAAPSDARAAGFEQAAARAIRVAQLDELVWALTATCDRGDEVQDRQCRLIRDRRAQAYAGATILVDAEPGTFTAGPWSPEKRSAPVRLTGCVRCAPLAIDGRAWHLTVGAPRGVDERGAVRTAPLYDSARVFPDEAAAKTWLAAASSVAATRVQLVLKVPARPRWQVAGKDGLALELVAYRVITPCTGGVVIAAPPADPAEADPRACTQAAAPAPAPAPAGTP